MLSWKIPKNTMDIPRNVTLLFQIDYEISGFLLVDTHVGKLIDNVVYDTYEKMDIAYPEQIARFVLLEELLGLITT